jgi:hypothetical protein
MFMGGGLNGSDRVYETLGAFVAVNKRAGLSAEIATVRVKAVKRTRIMES